MLISSNTATAFTTYRYRYHKSYYRYQPPFYLRYYHSLLLQFLLLFLKLLLKRIIESQIIIKRKIINTN